MISIFCRAVGPNDANDALLAHSGFRRLLIDHVSCMQRCFRKRGGLPSPSEWWITNRSHLTDGSAGERLGSKDAGKSDESSVLALNIKLGLVQHGTKSGR